MIAAVVNGLYANRAEVRADSTYVSRRPGDIGRMTGEALDRGAEKVIVVGGDGSVHEAAGAFLARSSRATLAILPRGTGNDFARCLGSEPRDVDAMDVRLGPERFFGVNSSQAGFGARVVEQSAPLKRLFGRMAYRLAIATALFRHRLVPIRVRIDGRAVGEYLAAAVLVANARYLGGGMSPLPRAVPDDGLLDVAIVNEFGRWSIVRHARLLRTGIPEGHDRIHLFRAREVTVESPEEAPVEADGELLGRLPAAWRVIPKGLRAQALE